MDRAELILRLEDFKNKCMENDYITGDVTLDEAYPTIVPTSFIVNVIVKDKWLENINRGDALDQLIDVLWETTSPEVRENVFTIAIYDENESLHSLACSENSDSNVLDRIVNSNIERSRKNLL